MCARDYTLEVAGRRGFVTLAEKEGAGGEPARAAAEPARDYKMQWPFGSITPPWSNPAVTGRRAGGATLPREETAGAAAGRRAPAPARERGRGATPRRRRQRSAPGTRRWPPPASRPAARS